MLPGRFRHGSRLGADVDRAGWRRRIRREVAWLLVVKLAALTLLWFVFFSPAQRQHVDAEVVSRQLGVAKDSVGQR